MHFESGYYTDEEIADAINYANVPNWQKELSKVKKSRIIDAKNESFGTVILKIVTVVPALVDGNSETKEAQEHVRRVSKLMGDINKIKLEEIEHNRKKDLLEKDLSDIKLAITDLKKKEDRENKKAEAVRNEARLAQIEREKERERIRTEREIAENRRFQEYLAPSKEALTNIFIERVQTFEKKGFPAAITNTIVIEGQDAHVRDSLMEWLIENSGCHNVKIEHNDNDFDTSNKLQEVCDAAKQRFNNDNSRTLIYLENADKLLLPNNNNPIIDDLKSLMCKMSRDYHCTMVFHTPDSSLLDKIALEAQRAEKINLPRTNSANDRTQEEELQRELTQDRKSVE